MLELRNSRGFILIFTAWFVYVHYAMQKTGGSQVMGLLVAFISSTRFQQDSFVVPFLSPERVGARMSLISSIDISM